MGLPINGPLTRDKRLWPSSLDGQNYRSGRPRVVGTVGFKRLCDSHPCFFCSTDKMGSSSLLNHGCRLIRLKMQLVWLFGLVPLAAGLDSESCKSDSTEMLFLHIPYNFGYTVAS